MISNTNPTEWLKFSADDESGQLEPEPHQLPSEDDSDLPALLRKQAA